MRPILVPSSAKHIATQILVDAKLNGRKYLFGEALFVKSSVPTSKYLFKVSNWNTRSRHENFKIKDEDAITSYYQIAFEVIPSIMYHHNSMSESGRIFCEGVYFRLWFWLKNCYLSFYQLLFIDLLTGRLIRSFDTIGFNLLNYHG